VCVPIPARSTPGSQRTSNPCIRARRARMSWMELFNTWPSVSTPVMFGGGITIENGGFDGFGFATKSRCSIHRWYHVGSTDFGSYLFGSSAMAINHPKAGRLCKCRCALHERFRLLLRIYV